ncbi:MAG: coproporphyrinogen III oxidase [Rhodospirillales bacterium]|nr:coproporphyrinogen III oxidase [Rhodospirillales bacterium]
MHGAHNADLALYVHWPFCLAKCPYCDFNSHVRAQIDQARWRDALLRELQHYADRLNPRRLTSIFFGGGTPSLMPGETVAAAIEAACAAWTPAPDLEITLEANPTSVETGRFSDYAAAGVERLSLGVQALNDRALAFLGRQHSATEAMAALDLALARFPRVTFDLIYARPGQSLADWQQELTEALALGSEHLSLYQLVLEEGTRFHAAARRGELRLPEEEAQVVLFEATQALTARAGLPAYEISNHARPGRESRHNLTYWRYGDYLGIGPGAHSRLSDHMGRWAQRQHRAPEVWLERVERKGHAEQERNLLSPERQLEELTVMGLRLTDGLSLTSVEARLGAPLESLLPQDRLQRLIERGLLEKDADGLRATASGRLRLDALLRFLFAC